MLKRSYGNSQTRTPEAYKLNRDEETTWHALADVGRLRHQLAVAIRSEADSMILACSRLQPGPSIF